MAFPSVSTSVETRRLRRAVRVLNRRRRVARLVSTCEVFACKLDAPGLWSAHDFGDAGDCMTAGPDANRVTVAHAVIHDATHRTWANGFRRTDVCFVIWNETQWTKPNGERPYTGVPHTNHVHVACSPSVRIRPACDGGTNYAVPYAHGKRGSAHPPPC